MLKDMGGKIRGKVRGGLEGTGGWYGWPIGEKGGALGAR